MRLKVLLIMSVIGVALLVVTAVPAFAFSIDSSSCAVAGDTAACASPSSSCAIAGETFACAVSNFFDGFFGFFFNLFGFSF